jgi:hypothetical protein
MLRFWSGVIRRWTVALLCALASTAVGGAGYALVDEAVRGRTRFAPFTRRVRELRRAARAHDDTGGAQAIRSANELRLKACERPADVE